MAWRAAPSVAAALSQATALWPGRATYADGTIGDAAHAARQSDHNPDSRGIVHAFDLTHDPVHGVDCEVLAEHLKAEILAGREKRVTYLIWNRRIFDLPVSSDWRSYTGTSPHTEHIHVSIAYSTAAENDTSPWWALSSAPAPVPATGVVMVDPEVKAAFAALDTKLDTLFTVLEGYVDKAGKDTDPGHVSLRDVARQVAAIAAKVGA